MRVRERFHCAIGAVAPWPIDLLANRLHVDEMGFPPPQTEFRILAFDRNAKPGSLPRRGRFTELNGYSYLGRLCVRGRVVAEIGMENREVDGVAAITDACAKALPDLEFKALVSALSSSLKWPDAAVLALAISLVSPPFPARIFGWRFKGKRGRGRPPPTGLLTRQVFLFGRAWEWITGKEPTPSAMTVYVRALHAAAPYLSIKNRQGKAFSEGYLHESVQREQDKVRSDDYEMISPREATAN